MPPPEALHLPLSAPKHPQIHGRSSERQLIHHPGPWLNERKCSLTPSSRRGPMKDLAVDDSEVPMRFALLPALVIVIVACQGKPPAAGEPPPRLERIQKSKMPAIDKPVLFDTPEADAIVSALEIFPPDNPWNTAVESWPLHPRSKEMIATIGANRPMRYNPDMAYVLIPPDQKKVG